MKRSWIVFIIVLFLTASALNVSAQKNGQLNTKIVDANLCDLLDNPTKFQNSMIRVKATYRFGFEWSELYCSDCNGKGIVWVNFEEEYENSKKKYRKKLKWTERGKTVNVVFVGKFEKGRFGHMGGYPYQISVERVEKADVIYNDSPVNLPATIKAKTFCRTD
jgi:hypothetical protein